MALPLEGKCNTNVLLHQCYSGFTNKKKGMNVSADNF